MNEPAPVKHHAPILTIKIKNVVIQSSIGKEWFIEINPVGLSTESKRIRLGKQNTLILQKSWDTNQPESVSVQIKITEKDKIRDISGPEDYDLDIDKTLPIDNDPDPKIISGHRKGQKTISITVAGSGGDKGKTAKAQILFEWFLSSNMHDLVAYILSEMINNLNTPEFSDLKKILDNTNKLKNSTNLLLATLNPQESIAISEYNKIKAYLDFTKLVGYGKIWDHKEVIYKTCGEWSLDAEKGTSYRFDLFSNIHYGFIGRAAGFSRDDLLDGAGLAQAFNEKNYEALASNLLSLRKFDDPIDQEAIKLGMDIWEKYKKTISANTLLKRMQNKRTWKGGRKPADEGTNK